MLLYSERKNMAKVTYGKQRDHDNFHNIIVERFDFDISLPRVIGFPLYCCTIPRKNQV